MNKLKTIHECSKCGAQFSKWQGRCSECQAWGTVSQEAQSISEPVKSEIKTTPDTPVLFSDIKTKSADRLKTGIEEIDRVLGGGIVIGSLILLGGDPGIGKSTMALQIAQNVGNLLYISGEESANQVKMRSDRLNIDAKQLKFISQTNIEKIIATIESTKPSLVIIDSIQTVNSAGSSAGLGSAAQITSSTSQLMELAKKTNIPIIIIGHVTKEGFVAGPKALEHLVDTVLYLENDNRNFYKILRSVKNRFGSIGEIGIFEMTSLGLKEIKDSSNVFIEEHKSPAPGSAISIIIEGTRPFLVEIQALTARTSFGYPQRKSTGFDLNRLQMIIAVISKIAKIDLSNHDVYLNIAGGLKVKETAIDLAVGLAIISAFKEKSIPANTIIIGEVGLSGEVRPVPQIDARLKEADRLQFKKAILSKMAKKINGQSTDLEIGSAENIIEAINLI
jgi:DNA repair protein RadA/Sms